MKMNAIIKEVALYVFFVACLCIVSYSHRDPKSFAFRKTMYDTFVDGVYGGKKSFSAVSFSLNVNELLITSLAYNHFTCAHEASTQGCSGFSKTLFDRAWKRFQMCQLKF